MATSTTVTNILKPEVTNSHSIYLFIMNIVQSTHTQAHIKKRK